MPPVHRPGLTAARVRERLGPDPFVVTQAYAAGLSRGQLRAAVDAGLLVRLRTGVLALPSPAGSDTTRRDALAALAVMAPGAVISHETAGRLERLPDRRPGTHLSDVTTTAPVTGRRRAGIRVVEGLVEEADVEVVDGVRCTSVARTALDLAAGRGLGESLVVLDAANSRAGLPTILESLDRLPRSRGTTALRRAVALSDGRSESPLESASRGEIITAGLPPPEIQAWVVDEDGRAWRVDFLWRDRRVIGEADGWGKYATAADLRAEKVREDALRRAGWTVVRWTSDELWRTPALVVRRIARALAA